MWKINQIWLAFALLANCQVAVATDWHMTLDNLRDCVESQRSQLHKLSSQPSWQGVHHDITKFYTDSATNNYAKALGSVKSHNFKVNDYTQKWKQFIENEQKSGMHQIDLMDLYALSQIYNLELSVYNISMSLQKPILYRPDHKHKIKLRTLVTMEGKICFLDHQTLSKLSQINENHSYQSSIIRPRPHSLHSPRRTSRINTNCALQQVDQTDANYSHCPLRRDALAEALSLSNKRVDYSTKSYEMRMHQEVQDARRSRILSFCLSSSQTEVQYLNSLKRNFGLERVKLPADGNCGFSAILYALLGRLAHESEVDDFRSHVASHMQKHQKLYQSWSWAQNSGLQHHEHNHFDDDHMILNDFEGFIRKLIHDKQWLNDLHLHAAADMLDVKIAVFERRTFSPVIRVFEPTMGKRDQRNLHVIFIYHQSASHFDFLY